MPAAAAAALLRQRRGHGRRPHRHQRRRARAGSAPRHSVPRRGHGLVRHPEATLVSIPRDSRSSRVVRSLAHGRALRCSGKGGGLGSLASSQSVSFRQGSNVEFGGVTAPPGTEPAYTLEETGGRKGRDFSNPMYEAVTRAVASGDPEPPLRKYPASPTARRSGRASAASQTVGLSAAGIYEVPDELKEKVASAVISPSSTETRGAGAGAGAGGRRRALDPAGDSTADTAQLVLEDKLC